MSNNASSVTRQYSFRIYSFNHSNIINENDLPNSVFGKLSDIACDVLNKTIPGTLVAVADGLVPVWRKHIKTRHVDPSWPSLLNAIIFPSMAGTVLMLSPSDRYRHCVLASRGIELVYIGGAAAHGDVIIWKQFPRYWPFVRGINRSRVNFLHKGQWRGAVMFFFYLRLNKRLSKQWWGWWFETPSRPLWLHCNWNGLVCQWSNTVSASIPYELVTADVWAHLSRC